MMLYQQTKKENTMLPNVEYLAYLGKIWLLLLNVVKKDYVADPKEFAGASPRTSCIVIISGKLL